MLDLDAIDASRGESLAVGVPGDLDEVARVSAKPPELGAAPRIPDPDGVIVTTARES